MMPPSQPATSKPPTRGEYGDHEPAHYLDRANDVHGVLAISRDQVIELGARYLGESLMMTSANLSRLNRIGAT